MNPLVQGLFKNFCKSEELGSISQSDAFELFSASLVIPDEVTSQAQLTDLLLDQGTIGIDVIVIEINGKIVWDSDDVTDVCDQASQLSVAVYFIQAKYSEKISSPDILNFGKSVKDFLKGEGFHAYRRTRTLVDALAFLFSEYAGKLKGSPSVNVHFCTAAPKNSVESEVISSAINDVKSSVESLGFIGAVSAEVLGANDIHESWNRKNKANEVEVQLEKHVNLPRMTGVDQAILGVVSVSELLKLIQGDENGILDERVFYDNVRGFDGIDNPVNKKIIGTLKSEEKNLLPVLNNGVTVVASSYSPKPGDAVVISDYQIVNGCQTSHCIYIAKDSLGEDIERVFVPIRIVVTGNEDVANSIVRATNSQTAVRENDLVALTKFQKRLEEFYRLDTQDVGLTYERRSGQFYGKEVTKARVVNINDQLKAVAAMFLDMPHLATRYPSHLYYEVNSSIFLEAHKLLPYVASAYGAYRLENAFRTGLDPAFKPVRYHLLMAYKYHVLKHKSAPLDKNQSERDSEAIITALRQPGQVSVFQNLANMIVQAGGGTLPSTDRLKRQQFARELVSHSFLINDAF
ncbi:MULTISPECIES: AIPR family protein [unclassified Nocardiopsis]|uniref:AIPR family protein n=1 Tax=unclassified Nocardiopsis TaxID=2649073 RepID=UPI001359C787|nr:MULTISPECIES: AIPR family protein [unclassified Nocardiopsis]